MELFCRSFLASSSTSLRLRIVVSKGQFDIHGFEPIGAADIYILRAFGALKELRCWEQVFQLDSE